MIRARLAERVSRGRAVTVPGRHRLEIVWIEQAPLRASAAGECTDMMTRLEQARLCWHQFERQDKPAFVRWRAREFGALLSTAPDVEDKIRKARRVDPIPDRRMSGVLRSKRNPRNRERLIRG